MDAVVRFLSLSTLFLHVCGQEWACQSAEKCSSFIQRQLNLTESSSDQNVTIDICLNRQSDINQCISVATGECNWQGIEPEFYKLLQERIAVKDKCNALCSNLEEIRGCAEKISFSYYVSQRYDDYCRSYHESLKCKNDTLFENPCSFGEQLFQIGFGDSIRKIFRYMCNPGCDNVTVAWRVLENCTRIWKLTDQNCSAYLGFEECLKNHNTCTQIRQMVPYFSPMYEELQTSCRRTTPLQTETSTSGAIVNLCLAPLTFTVVVSNATICTAVECLIKDGISLEYLSSLRVKDSILKLLRERWTICPKNRSTIITGLQTTVMPQTMNGTMATNSTTKGVTEYFTEAKTKLEKQSHATKRSTPASSVVPKVDPTTTHAYFTESTTVSEKRGYSPNISNVDSNEGPTTVKSMKSFTSNKIIQYYSPNISTVDRTVDTLVKQTTNQPINLFTSDKNITQRNQSNTQDYSLLLSTVDNSEVQVNLQTQKQYTLVQNDTRITESGEQGYSPTVHNTDTTLDTAVEQRNVQTHKMSTFEKIISEATRHHQPRRKTTPTHFMYDNFFDYVLLSTKRGKPSSTEKVSSDVTTTNFASSKESLNGVVRSDSAMIHFTKSSQHVSSSFTTSTVLFPTAAISSTAKIPVLLTTQEMQKEEISKTTRMSKATTTISKVRGPEGQSRAPNSIPAKVTVLFSILICVFFII